jgi:hypothetical protein
LAALASDWRPRQRWRLWRGESALRRHIDGGGGDGRRCRSEKNLGASSGEELGGAWGREPSSTVAFDVLTPAGCRLRAFAGELILATPSTEKSPSEQAARAAERGRSCGQGRPRPARTGGRFFSLRAAAEVLRAGAPTRPLRRPLSLRGPLPRFLAFPSPRSGSCLPLRASVGGLFYLVAGLRPTRGGAG